MALARSNKNKSKEFEELCLEFLQEHCQDELTQILTAELNEQYHVILVSHTNLHAISAALGDAIVNQPSLALKGCDDAARRALANHYERLCPDVKAKCTLKRNVHVRFHSIPDQPEVCTLEFPVTKDVGAFICISGTVVRTSSPKLLEYAKLYRCSRCKQTFEIEANLENFHNFPKRSTKCNVNLCINATITQVDETNSAGGSSTTKYRDYQEIKLQEQVQKLEFGAIPKSLSVILEDDLVDACKPGDDVTMCGEVVLRWRSLRSDRRADSELCFKANSVQVNNNQRASVLINEETEQFMTAFWEKYSNNPLDGRNHILASFCPQIYGMYIAKLALCVILCGGVGKERNGNRIRGESHLLLVGDPGTGKSQLLKYVSKVFPRSVMTTGIGTTTAGLTVSAVKDGGEWQLEAGALVLADGGVCCIDEFSCIKEHDRTSIHEAMEQQTISVAKAGMVCKLTTRCTIIASTNPKGKYDPNECLPVNIAIPSPLLSRFDVLLVLRDAQNDNWDSLVADFILQGKDPYNKTVNAKLLDLWDVEKLQSYLVMVKELKPKLTDRANEVLSAYYQFQRRSETRNSARTTVRLLESLIRLAEGHARLMFQNEVTLLDSIMAISLIESSMQGFNLLSEANILHTSFPEDSFEEYKTQAHLILSRLNLEYLWEEEMNNMPALLNDTHEPSGSNFENRTENVMHEKNHENIEDDIVNASISNPSAKRPRIEISPERSPSQGQGSQIENVDPQLNQNFVAAAPQTTKDDDIDANNMSMLSPSPSPEAPDGQNLSLYAQIDNIIDQLPEADFLEDLNPPIPVPSKNIGQCQQPLVQNQSVNEGEEEISQKIIPHQIKPSSRLIEFRKRLDKFKRNK